MNQPPVKSLAWTEDTVTTFWDHWSQFADTYFATQFGRSIAALIARRIPAGGHILDYGCGQGTLIGHLLDHGFRASGLDLSGQSVEHSQARLAGRPGLEGIFRPADIVGKKFDAVVLAEVIEHLDEDTRRQVLTKIHDLLAPGGSLVVTVPNAEDLAKETVFCPCCRHTFHRWQHVQSFDAERLESVLTEAGFLGIRTLETNFGALGWKHPLAHLAAMARRVLKPKNRPPHLVAFARRG